MEQCTKGDWKVEDTFRVIDGDGKGIAHSLKPTVSEAVANAHLISASPDLYEACKLALDEAPWQPLGDDIKQVIRQAIAKAEGKS